jgi:hypothetical protein
VFAGGQGFTLPTDKNDTEELSADEFESNTNSLFDHLEPQYIDDESSNAAAQEATTDPDAGLPTTLKGEIQGLRYAIQQMNHASTWKDYEENTVITTNVALSADVTNYIMSCTNDCTVTIAAASTLNDKEYFITNKASTVVTIDPNASETIGGVTTHTLTGASKFVRILCDASNWHIQAESYVGQFHVMGNLYAYANHSVYTTTISADYLTVANAGGDLILLNSILESSNINSTLLHGLDVGASANSTRYHVFIVYNPTTADTDTLISSSSTSPVLPSGYTYFRMVSMIRTISTGSDYVLAFNQQGTFYMYSGTDIAGGGTFGTRFYNAVTATGSWSNADTSGFIPTCPTFVSKVYINFYNAGDGGNPSGAKFQSLPDGGSMPESIFTYSNAASYKDYGFFWVNVYEANGRFQVKGITTAPTLSLAVAGFMFRF